MLTWRLTRIAACAAACAAAAARAAAQNASPPARTVPGIAYDIRVVGQRESGGIATVAPGTQSYSGHAVFAANRGRVDILEGGAAPLFGKGDYVLFDTSDMLVVRPATKDFVPLPHELGSMGLDQLTAMGVKLSVTDVKVTMDSLGPSDTVAGLPTHHFRMTLGFNMSIDAGFTQQAIGTESVTDYWVAAVPGLPGNPLLRASGVGQPFGAGGVFADLTRRADSASKLMGPTVALKTKTVSKVVQGPGAVLTTEQSSDVSNIRHEDVDVTRLVLPEGYKATALPGMEKAVAPDAGAKWRVTPGARRL